MTRSELLPCQECGALFLARADNGIHRFCSNGCHGKAVVALAPAKPKRDYPFCDTSKCPHWRGYCRRDPACNN